MKQVILLLLAAAFIMSCNEKAAVAGSSDINQLAEKYVRLALDINRYDSSFVDAYYGPDSLKPTSPRKSEFPKDSFLLAVQQLQEAFTKLTNEVKNDTVLLRANWMKAQLTAFGRRIKIFSGENVAFDKESVELYSVAAPVYPESHYQSLIAQLDALLPGKGTVPQRFQSLANRFIIPKNKLDTVFKASIAECRKRTMQHYTIPAGEDFKLEFVTDKPWSGYNWYKGNYQSVIQINTDVNIFIDRAIDVGSHESYPGHHVYNMLLEKNLYRDKGWVEISMYPLYSPQSLIAEGSANYGIDVVFPGNDKVTFCKTVLLPLAGLDSNGITTYFKALAIKGELNFAGNEAGRGILNKTMDSTTVMHWLKDYCLYNDESAKKRIRFIEVNRSYIINYNYGMELVKNYVEKKAGSEAPEKRWNAFGELLSSPTLPSDLLKESK